MVGGGRVSLVEVNCQVLYTISQMWHRKKPWRLQLAHESIYRVPPSSRKQQTLAVKTGLCVNICLRQTVVCSLLVILGSLTF